MDWTSEAKEAINRVPFFVRRRVAKRVEEEAHRVGAREVSIEHVGLTQRKFLSNMESEIKGYRVETCFGSSGCPNRVTNDDSIVSCFNSLLESADLVSFLKKRVEGSLKLHHEFRVSVSDCPNACSRPQIVDIGLIGACSPAIEKEPCIRCGSCVECCREGAVSIPDCEGTPVIDRGKCVSCGACAAACPTGTIGVSEKGFRILLGGKLGRHPQLGRELGRIYTSVEAREILQICLEHYLKHNLSGERFGEVLIRFPIEDLE